MLARIYSQETKVLRHNFLFAAQSVGKDETTKMCNHVHKAEVPIYKGKPEWTCEMMRSIIFIHVVENIEKQVKPVRPPSINVTDANAPNLYEFVKQSLAFVNKQSIAGLYSSKNKGTTPSESEWHFQLQILWILQMKLAMLLFSKRFAITWMYIAR